MKCPNCDTEMKFRKNLNSWICPKCCIASYAGSRENRGGGPIPGVSPVPEKDLPNDKY